MKHIYSVIMALVTSMIIFMPSNVALAQSTGGDGGTADGVVTGGDGATVSSPITIEGDFSDWAALEKEFPNICVSASSDDNARYTGLYKVLFFANNDSLFFYIEYSDSTQVQEAGTYYVTDMINIMLHTGGLSTTGMTIFNDEDVWQDLTNVQIAGSPRTQFANANILVYQDSTQTWEMIELPVSPISACMPVEEETSDHARIEGAIALRQLPVEIKELKVGVIGVETGNVTSGVLPQVSLSPSDGVKIIQPMLSLPWSIAGEEEQSGMCGDKVIWTLTGKTLMLSGGGEMWDFTPYNPATYSKFMERIDTVIMEGSVTKVSKYAFYHLENLKYIALPEFVDTIDIHAFDSCYSLEHITLPNSVRYIGHDAFAYCSGLYSAILPAELQQIPANLFAFCHSLSRVQIPSTVTSIGDNAFYLCENLPTVALSSELKEIYGGAFAGCTGLKEMQCEAVVPPALVDAENNPVFNNVPSTIPLYVRAKSVKIYQRTEGWNYFENIQPIDGDSLEPTEVTIFGITITPGDSASTNPIDLLGDSTIVYAPADNTLSFNSVDWSVGEDETVAINYTGDEALTIVLNGSSTIMADTVIASTADITITGDGHLVAEGVTPIVGVSYATITFESVNMYVRSVPTPQALRRRIRYGKKLDENGGPALSGFASADFNKTSVTPPDAEYGKVEMEESAGGGTINALYTVNENGDKVIVTEFTLTANDATGVENMRVRQAFDPTQPMYNVLGIPVDATYKGIVIQNEQTFLLR